MGAVEESLLGEGETSSSTSSARSVLEPPSVEVAEQLEQAWADLDAACPVALRRTGVADLAGAVNEDRRGAPVDVAPGQRDGLADAKAGADQDLGEWPVRRGAGVEIRPAISLRRR